MTTSPADPSANHVTVDLGVIGAGPAGLAAAVTAAERGLSVALIDAESVAGGQFWRHPSGPPDGTGDDVADLHHDLHTYRDLLARARAAAATGRLDHRPQREVWSVQTVVDIHQADSARFAVNALARSGGPAAAETVTARNLLVATGAYDLQVPFPGWELPGVMTAGGVQSLLKGHGVLAGRRVAVAGTGPFLLSVAAGLGRRGALVVGVFEAAAPTRWLRELGAVSGARGKLIEGAGYAKDLLRQRIPYRTRWTVIRADGDDALRSLTVAPVDRSGGVATDRARTLDVDVLAVGWGFVPQIELAVGLGCDTVADPQGLAVLRVDAAGRTSVPGVFAAGEVCGVGGAALAVVEGELTGIAIARSLGGGVAGGAASPSVNRDDTARIAKLLRRRRSLANFAAALHRAHPVPRTWLATLSDEALVCRCEEVTAGAVREAIERDGATDARTVKLLVRPGMGWCQGRMCGFATERLVQDCAGRAGPPVTVVPERPIAFPTPLGVLAGDARAAGRRFPMG